MRESLFSTAKSHVLKSPAFRPSNPAKTGTVPVHPGADMGAPGRVGSLRRFLARRGEKTKGLLRALGEALTKLSRCG
jgi:hypothetical protein